MQRTRLWLREVIVVSVAQTLTSFVLGRLDSHLGKPRIDRAAGLVARGDPLSRLPDVLDDRLEGRLGLR
eukprot:1657450-Prymnesium_polylepis.1